MAATSRSRRDGSGADTAECIVQEFGIGDDRMPVQAKDVGHTSETRDLGELIAVHEP